MQYDVQFAVHRTVFNIVDRNTRKVRISKRDAKTFQDFQKNRK